MAFTNFYLIAGGVGSADINAGSSIGAAQATTTNGNWNAATGVFIAAAGTPFAATVVGDYAAVYVDGAAVTLFVGRVTTVTSNVNITVDVATIKYGAAIPTTSATGRSCTINGSWNTEQVLAAGGLATFVVPQSTKINIKGNLTFAAARIISIAGSTTVPLWFSGYNTTPGDLDNDTTNTLAKPIWTTGANLLTCSGTYQMWSSVSVVGNRSGAATTFSGSNQRFIRLRVENISANAAAFAATQNSSNNIYDSCWFKAPATGTTTAVFSMTTGASMRGCIFDGGGLAGLGSAATIPILRYCIFLNNPIGILATTGVSNIEGCTFYNCTTDGIKWSGAPGAGSFITGCIFVSGSSATTNGINNASGTNTGNIYRSCNDYYSITNPEVGLGDSPSFFGQTESISPVTSATNMTPVPGSNALIHGFPGIFEDQAFSSYLDIGAVQKANPTLAVGFVGM